MEAPSWIRASEGLFNNKDLADGDFFHPDTSEISNAKRKIESLFCVLTKRNRRHYDMFMEKDECMIVEDGIGSDTDLSGCSDFDIISEHVIQDMDSVTSSKSPCPNDDEGILVNKLSLSEVNIEGSMEKMRSNDELRLWNTPIPLCIVPPECDSSILLETCSLHRIRDESNVCDDHTPMPLRKTLEGPSRPWSVCGSLAAGRNLPVVEGNTCACSSMDEELCVNVNSEDREATQRPSALYSEEDDGEDEICFADVDAMIRKLNLVPDDFDSCLNRKEWDMSMHPTHTLLGLNHCTRTSVRRAVMFHGAIAVLHCPDSQHFIRKHEVIIGRSSNGMRVDIDLGKDGYGSKISRRQALVKLEKNGSVSLENLGKRHILVNGEKLETGQIVTLTLCSSIEIRGIVFVLKINKEAVRQFLKNNTGRTSKDDTKFRWCE